MHRIGRLARDDCLEWEHQVLDERLVKEGVLDEGVRVSAVEVARLECLDREEVGQDGTCCTDLGCELDVCIDRVKDGWVLDQRRKVALADDDVFLQGRNLLLWGDDSSLSSTTDQPILVDSFHLFI
jgi:hypothetical protein